MSDFRNGVNVNLKIFKNRSNIENNLKNLDDIIEEEKEVDQVV